MNRPQPVKSWFQTGKRSTNEFHTDHVYDNNQQYVNERAADFFSLEGNFNLFQPFGTSCVLIRII